MNEPYFPDPSSVGRLRYLINRWFRFWFYLLNCYASKHVAETDSIILDSLTDNKLIKENERYQSKLSQLFSRQCHICSSCSECCFHEHHPKYAVDCLLLNSKEGHIRLSRFNLVQVCRGVISFIPHAIGSSIPKNEEGLEVVPCRTSCEELTEYGCKLPWGYRYVICVIYLCPKYCQLMTWQEYLDYLTICFKYMIHVTMSTRKIISKWQKLT